MRVTRTATVGGLISSMVLAIVPGTILAVVLAIVVAIVPGTATAQASEFRFELNAGFLADRVTTRSTPITITPNPPPDLPVLTIDTDTDEFSVAAAWYFDGASAASGPMSRAAFVSRASSLAIAYSRGDIDTDVGIDPPIVVTPDPLPGPILPFPPGVIDPTPIVFELGGDIDELATQLRYVWPDSGWYALASVATLDTKLNTGLQAVDVDSQRYVAGFGRYIAELTTLDIAVARIENDFSGPFAGDDDSATEVAVTLSHIGALAGDWQYGADASISSVDADDRDGDFGIRGSLYPNRALAFGLGITGSFGNDNAPTTYNLFASWFATERFGISASFGIVDTDDPPGTDVDQDRFGLEAVARF